MVPSSQQNAQWGGILSPPGRRTGLKRSASIKFDKNVCVRKIPSINDLTEDPQDLWYQQEEVDAIKRRSFEELSKAEDCRRGLEKFEPSTRKRILNMRYEAWDSVLDEQEHQRYSGTGSYDEDEMARLYSESTRHSQTEAMLQGKKDEMEIKQDLHSTTITSDYDAMMAFMMARMARKQGGVQR